MNEFRTPTPPDDDDGAKALSKSTSDEELEYLSIPSNLEKNVEEEVVAVGATYDSYNNDDNRTHAVPVPSADTSQPSRAETPEDLMQQLPPNIQPPPQPHWHRRSSAGRSNPYVGAFSVRPTRRNDDNELVLLDSPVMSSADDSDNDDMTSLPLPELLLSDPLPAYPVHSAGAHGGGGQQRRDELRQRLEEQKQEIEQNENHVELQNLELQRILERIEGADIGGRKAQASDGDGPLSTSQQYPSANEERRSANDDESQVHQTSASEENQSPQDQSCLERRVERRILIGMLTFFASAGILLLVYLPQAKGGDSVPTIRQIPTGVPTVQPNTEQPSKQPGSAPPSLQPSRSPGPTITSSPTSQYSCFSSTAELRSAVDDYLLDDGAIDSMVSQTFGWPIGRWCVSNIQDFSRLFSYERNQAVVGFNDEISGWDTSRATNMSDMFRGAESFDGNVSNWNVSSVTDMRSLFHGAASFDGDLSAWHVSRVTDMSSMFKTASSFNGNISTWDVSGAANLSSMFEAATRFNGDLSLWDVSTVSDMEALFFRALDFNRDISRWNVSGVTSMRSMFQSAATFKGDISSWDVRRVTDMNSMFMGATDFDVDLSGWDVSKVNDMAFLFNRAVSFNQNIASWNVSRVGDFSHQFDGARSFLQNLCPWGSRMQFDATVTSMFVMTHCDDEDQPDLRGNPPGPLCFPCS